MKKRGFISVVLLMALTLTSCQGKGVVLGENSIARINDISLKGLDGRFKEERIEFPEKIESVYDMKNDKSGKIRIVFQGDQGNESLHYCESDDNGETWEKGVFSNDFLPKGRWIDSAALSPDGKIIVSTRSKEGIGEYVYFELYEKDEKMVYNQIKFSLPEPKKDFVEKFGYGLENIKIGNNGYLYGQIGTRYSEHLYSDYDMLCIDLKSGQVCWKYKIDWSDYNIYGNNILVKSEEEIIILDAINGEEKEEIGVLPIVSLEEMEYVPETEKFFYSNEKGIFATDHNQVATEQLLDGSNYKLSDVDQNITNFMHIDNTKFIIAFEGDESGLYSYKFDTKLPSQYDKKFTIYSLNDDNLIRKLISAFREKYQNVKFEYKVGISDENDNSYMDAYKLLNKELKSGKGADVIILNGLPWEYYTENNMLEDLSNELSYDTLYNNITSKFLHGEKQSVVPIGLQIPMLIGVDNRIKEVDSLDKLSELSISINSLSPFTSQYDMRIISFFTSLYWSTIQKSDKSISKQDMAVHLKDIDKFIKILEKKDGGSGAKEHFIENQIFPKYYGQYHYIIMPAESSAALEIGNIMSTEQFARIDTYNHDYKEILSGSFRALLTSVNKNSKEKKLAKDFIKFTLGIEGQSIISNSIEDNCWLPVNKEAFQNAIKKPSAEKMESIQEYVDYKNLKFKWPEKTYFDKLEKMIKEADTPVLDDEIIFETIYNEALPYIYNEVLPEKHNGLDLDATVNRISQALEQYLTE
jgi:hypothetical protein